MSHVILADPADRAVTDSAPAVVIASEDEVACWRETVHLLRSPANARRLLASIKEVRDEAGS